MDKRVLKKELSQIGEIYLMNRSVFKYLAVIAITVSTTSMSFIGDDRIKLLQTVVSDGDAYDKYEYDDQKRIVKTSSFNVRGIKLNTASLTYSNNDLVKTEMVFEYLFESNIIEEYTKIENKITIKRVEDGDVQIYTLYLNSDGLPDKYENEDSSYIVNYQYQDGNLLKYISKEDGIETCQEYKYDNKKSPFSDCKTPKWFMIWFLWGGFGIQNNITEIKWSDNTFSHIEYEYDINGYPTKKTTISSSGKKYISKYNYKD